MRTDCVLKEFSENMNFSSRISRPLLYQEVVNALYQIIDEQKLQPGAQFPSERELIEQLGVSRNVLREAFHVLEQRGIIVSHQGKGRFLRSLPSNGPQQDKYAQMSKNLERYSLREAYEVRQVLEEKAMELIVRNVSDEDLQELEAAYGRMVQKFQETGTTVGEFDLHRLYAKKTGSMFMEQTLDIVLCTILEMMQTTSHDVLDMHNVELEAKEHRQIVDALKQRDAEKAKRFMFDHIQGTIDYLK